jgi:YcxB-like protein
MAVVDMELTYRLSREEQLNYVRLAAARVMALARNDAGWTSSLVLTFAFTGLGILGLVWLHSARLISNLEYLVALGAAIWGVLVVCGCAAARQRVYRRVFWSDDSPALGEARLKLRTDGIEVSDRARTSTYPWQAFSEISQNGDLIVLWFDRGEGVRVPARAFANEEMRRTFIDTVRGRLPRAGA